MSENKMTDSQVSFSLAVATANFAVRFHFHRTGFLQSAGSSMEGVGAGQVDLRRTSPNRTHSCVTHQWAAFSRRRRRNTGTQLTVPAAMGVPPPHPPAWLCAFPARHRCPCRCRHRGRRRRRLDKNQAATQHSRRRCHGSAQTPQWKRGVQPGRCVGATKTNGHRT